MRFIVLNFGTSSVIEWFRGLKTTIRAEVAEKRVVEA
jgi:hypothetical protein